MSTIAVRLSDHFNNVGCTTDERRAQGDFDGWGRSFPWEDLHPLHSLLNRPGRPDNVSCEDQRIDLPDAVQVARCRVVGATEGGSFAEPLLLFGAGGAQRPLRIALSDWLAALPSFGEACLAEGTHVHEPDGDLWGPRPHLWLSEVPVDPPLRGVAIRLPANPSMHVFSIALLTAGPETGPP